MLLLRAIAKANIGCTPRCVFVPVVRNIPIYIHTEVDVLSQRCLLGMDSMLSGFPKNDTIPAIPIDSRLQSKKQSAKNALSLGDRRIGNPACCYRRLLWAREIDVRLPSNETPSSEITIPKRITRHHQVTCNSQHPCEVNIITTYLRFTMSWGIR